MNPLETEISRFHIHADRYLEAAKVILKENGPADSLIAPCCQNIGLSLELFLKARAMQAGLNKDDLRGFGHDLLKMWNKPWATDVREEAEQAAEAQMDKIFVRPGEPRLVDIRSPKDELQRELGWLNAGYSGEEEYALRYPRIYPKDHPEDKKTITVPSPEFLIPVLDHLINTFYPH